MRTPTKSFQRCSIVFSLNSSRASVSRQSPLARLSRLRSCLSAPQTFLPAISGSLCSDLKSAPERRQQWRKLSPLSLNSAPCFASSFCRGIRHRSSAPWRDLDAPDLAFCCPWTLSIAASRQHLVSGMVSRYGARNLAFYAGGPQASVLGTLVWECFCRLYRGFSIDNQLRSLFWRLVTLVAPDKSRFLPGFFMTRSLGKRSRFFAFSAVVHPSRVSRCRQMGLDRCSLKI